MANPNESSRHNQRDSSYDSPKNGAEENMANALGWFSIGLGLAELVAPSKMARLIGVDEDKNRTMLRAYGVREIAAGVGILSQPRPAGWLWGRVAGDMLDLASLGSALAAGSSNRARVATATAMVLGITALDLHCSRQLSRDSESDSGSGKVQVKKSLAINKPIEEVYGFWRDFTNFPRFMKYLESVEVNGGRSHWKVLGPGGKTFEWDAEIVEDQPNSVISWRSLEGSDIDNSGSVRFERAPGGRGTIVRVDLRYAPPGGVISASIAKLFGKEPGQEIEYDLRCFKQIMETGEVVQSDASIHPGMHAAQPPAGRLQWVAG
jgi:uncharacterized membrane protein